MPLIPSSPTLPSHFVHRWIDAVYGHGVERPRPDLAARMLEERPDLVEADPLLACAGGDEAIVGRALAKADWVNSTPVLPCPDCGASLGRPPLVAVTHSSLVRVPPFRDWLRRCVRLLLENGADPNQRHRPTPGETLSALYGAAGFNHDAEMARMLLAAGANPNDNESLYHATEGSDHACLSLLLDAGARVEGSNALHHQLDREDLEGLQLLLARTRDPNDVSSTIGSPLLWAIRRRRSAAHVKALLDAGADPRARTKEGVSAYLQASRYGLSDVAEVLAEAGVGETLSLSDRFVAACARADADAARRLQAAHPAIVDELSGPQLHQLPNLAAAGHRDAVMLMVELGWPVAVRGGDWSASALNHAVFRGDEALAGFLLDRGASWTERHGYGDNVGGTLAWASRNRPAEPGPHHGDWVGCARVLVNHGMPPDLPQSFGDDVADYLKSLPARAQESAHRP